MRAIASAQGRANAIVMLRPALLIAAAAATIAVAGCGGVNDPYQDRGQTTPRGTPPATTATSAATATTPATDADEVAPELSPAQRAAERTATRAARAFLRGYLPYSYGQDSGRPIRGATPQLKSDLLRQPPRVRPQLTKDARPRVTSLRASGQTRKRVYFIAQINDGRTSYGTTLTASRRGARWLISEVQ